MKLEVQRSFEKDVFKITNKKLASLLTSLITELEKCHSLFDIRHVKKMPAKGNFYVTAKWSTDDFAEIVTGTFTLAIGSTRTLAIFGENIAQPASNKSVIIEFLVKNVDEDYERIKDLTSEIVQKPTTMPWGNRSLLFRDPDGNLINFFTPVSP